MKARLLPLDGQFCPVCDEWIEIEEVGNLDCPFCKTNLVASDTDSDFEDWRLSERKKSMDDEKARSLFENFWNGIKQLFVSRQWDGSASRWPSTDSYCASCLIDVNSAAGREEKVQSHCKLPVHNPGSDAIDPEGLQAAAGGQGITQVSKPDDVPQEAWDSAVQGAANAIIEAYPNLLDRDAPASVYEVAGREPPEEERALSGGRLHQALANYMFELDNLVEGSDHYLVDIYADEDGLYALYTDRGKLYRCRVTVRDDEVIFGTRQQVMEMHQPTQTRMIIRQQENGQYRWFSISGTAVLNRSGEIDSRALFDSFIAHAEETGQYPIRLFYHQGSISRDGQPNEQAQAYRTGQADFLARDGYCYITSGLYDDTPLAQAEILARQNNPDFWGDSIGFWPDEQELAEIAESGISIPVYQSGVNVEITTLPESEAAHLFTRTEVQKMTLEGKVWEAYLALWNGDEEKAREWLEANPAARNRAIEENGMITRQEEGEEEPPELEIDDVVIERVAEVVDEKVTTQLDDKLDKVKEQLATRADELSAIVDRLTARIAELEEGKAVQQRQIEDDTPAKFKGTRVVYRPRHANVALEEDGMPYNEKAKANLPKGAY